MSKIISYFVGIFGLTVVKLVILGLYYSFLVAFFAFFLNGLFVLFNFLHDFFYAFSSYSANTDLCKFFGLLNVIGFIPVFNLYLPLLSSALVFSITLILYRNTKDVVDNFVKNFLEIG